MNRLLPVIKQYVAYAARVFTERGVKALCIAALHFLKAKAIKLLSCFTTDRDAASLAAILDRHAGRPVVVTRPRLDWDLPLFQRPHHLARHLARCGFLCFYTTDNWANDNVFGFKRIEASLYLTNRVDIIDSQLFQKIFVISSTDSSTPLDFIAAELAKGNLILYEYLDEIHELISGQEIPAAIRRRHEALLKDERCLVITTADKLYRDVQAHRTRNFALVTNGVEFSHFSHAFSRAEMPAALAPLVNSGRKIIGYFGALASWFDYELVLRVVRERPNYDVVLIGFDYDGSSQPYRLDKEPRLHTIGPIDYRDLPRHACWFDVATIPFRINAITESTSPIKLFEYMALGKPIVTTDMPECRKYESVLVAHSHDEFLRQLDRAVALGGDADYQAVLRREALANTWEAKAAEIAALIKANLSAGRSRG